MGSRNTVETIRKAVAAFNAGDRRAFRTALGRSYFTYLPAPDEPGADEVIGRLVEELAGGYADMTIELNELESDRGGARGAATARGTSTAALWGVPRTGRTIEWTVSFRVRPVEGGLAFNLENLSVPQIMDAFRQLEQVNPPDRMHLPPPHATSVIPDFLFRVAFNGQVADKPCSHLGEVRVIESKTTRCERCGPDDIWPTLRLCLTCGHVGCCDTSINKHARGHFEATGHPLMRSQRAGETWGWCYTDGVLIGGATIGGATIARAAFDREA
jgi:hypothetical protein